MFLVSSIHTYIFNKHYSINSLRVEKQNKYVFSFHFSIGGTRKSFSSDITYYAHHPKRLILSLLSDDQQSYIGNDIEDQKNDFEQPEERVYDYIEGFSGNRKPFALRTVDQIRGQYTHCDPEDQ